MLYQIRIGLGSKALEEILASMRGLEDPMESRQRVLSDMTPILDRRGLKDAASLVSLAGDSSDWLRGLLHLLPHLDDSLCVEAWQLIVDFTSGLNREYVQLAAFEGLQQQMGDGVLAIARGFTQATVRLDALIAVAVRRPQRERVALVAEAVAGETLENAIRILDRGNVAISG